MSVAWPILWPIPQERPRPIRASERIRSNRQQAREYGARCQSTATSTIERRGDGKWIAICATGADVVNRDPSPYEGRDDAMGRALQLAGFDTKDARPEWKPAAAPATTKRKAAATAPLIPTETIPVGPERVQAPPGVTPEMADAAAAGKPRRRTRAASQ